MTQTEILFKPISFEEILELSKFSGCTWKRYALSPDRINVEIDINEVKLRFRCYSELTNRQRHQLIKLNFQFEGYDK